MVRNRLPGGRCNRLASPGRTRIAAALMPLRILIRPVNACWKFSVLWLLSRWQRAAIGFALAVMLAACSSGPAPLVQGGEGGTVAVRPGDSLYKIARRHNVSLRALIDVNRALPPYVIHPGQTLRLPSRQVSRAASASGPRRSSGRAPAIAAGRGTGKGSADNARKAVEPAAKSVRADGQDAKAKGRRDGKAGRTVAAVPRAKHQTPSPGSGDIGFIWPLKGTVISRYGPIGKGLYNDGINIAAPRGTAVRAAGGGVVAYAGNEIRGFGNLILIRHAKGWVSAYAHNGKMLVEQGQKVRQGQVVSRVGASGNVSRPQLHFELRQGNRAVNPERYLKAPIAALPGGGRIIEAWFRSGQPGTGQTAMRHVPSERRG